MRRPALALALTLATLAACSRGADDEGKRRLFTPGEVQGAPDGAFDFARPGAALAIGPGDVARRLGSFEWTTAVEWSVSRQGDDAQRVRAVERHRLRQSATGDFEVVADVDPGLGPGSSTGKEIVFTGGLTYARAKHAPFRVRPTDRGRDAHRFRDESFFVAAEALRLYGDALAITPAGETSVLGRPARRYKLALVTGVATPRPRLRPAGAPEPDEDTRRRLRFLDGRIPASADGELVLDAVHGVPLRIRLTGAFTVKDEPGVRATLELLGQVRALGGEVAAIAAPSGALPDERKPAGVAGALEAAGLREREEGKPQRDEPGDEPAE